MPAKVLLVEDDNNLREIYQARLMAEGYTIVTARDGEEALGVAKAEIPDLIISDVMMPRVSGFEMLDILRNTEGLKDTKVIMLTALGQADDKTRANSLGADRYLVKSQVTLEDIVKTSHELLEGGAPQTPGASAPAPAAPQATAPAASPVMPPAPSPAPPAPVTPAPAPTMPVVPAPAPVQPAPVVSPPTPVQPTPAPMAVAPAPEPAMPLLPGAPMPAPAAVPPVPAVPPAMPAVPAPVATAPTASEEQAAIGAQIDQFIKSGPGNAAPATSTTAAQDDAVLADAMEDLAESSGAQPATPPAPAPAVEPEPAPTAPAPVPPTPATPEAPTHTTPPDDSPSDAVPIANKKVIQPLNGSEPKPAIHEVLARETAAGLHGDPVVPPAPATTFSPSTPGAAPTPPTGPVVTMSEPVVSPTSPVAPPASAGPTDPSNISL